jgi:hypothetical protein
MSKLATLDFIRYRSGHHQRLNGGWQEWRCHHDPGRFRQDNWIDYPNRHHSELANRLASPPQTPPLVWAAS